MKFSSLALAGALAVAVAAPSLAQPAPPPGSPPPAGGRQWRQPDPAEMAQRREERLSAALQLRPDQQPALKALMAALQPDPAKMQRWKADRDQADKTQVPIPERLDKMQARMAERQADFARKADAIKRFYAQLTPAQQGAFNAMPMMLGHGGRGGPGGPGGRGFGGPHGDRDGPPPGPPPGPMG
jgi:hypothetical protein